MRSEEIEEALRRLLGEAAGPSGLVITLRRHEEYEVLLEKLQELQKKYSQLEYEYYQMSLYAQLYLRCLDELKIAADQLRGCGLDVSWISSIRAKR